MKRKLFELTISPAGEGPIDEAELADKIRGDGAVVCRGLLSQGAVPRLREALVAALEEDRRKFGTDYIFNGMVHALMTRGEPFLMLLGSRALRGMMQSVLGKGCIVHAYNSSSMPPGKSNYSRAIHVDCPRLIPGYVTNLGITIALDPFTSDNGAMEIAPTLRDRFEAPDEKTFEAESIALDDLRPGDAVLFDTRCWHRGGVNLTGNWRHAVSMNVCRSYMRQQFDFPRIMGEAMWSALDSEVQQFLGCHVRMPASLDEFLLPSQSRPYRPNQE